MVDRGPLRRALDMNTGVLVDTIRQLSRLPQREVQNILLAEPPQYKVTRSLLNILFNVCFTRSVHLNQQQLRQFRPFEALVRTLLSRPRSTSTGRYLEPDIGAKHRVFLRNPALVQLLARVCPTTPQLEQLLRLRELHRTLPTSEKQEGEEGEEEEEEAAEGSH